MPEPLFQSKAKGEATDMKIIFILMQIELIFSQRKVLHLASFWKWHFFGTRQWPIKILPADNVLAKIYPKNSQLLQNKNQEYDFPKFLGDTKKTF